MVEHLWNFYWGSLYITFFCYVERFQNWANMKLWDYIFKEKRVNSFEVGYHLSLFPYHCCMIMYVTGSFQYSWVILFVPSIFCVIIKKFDPADSGWKNTTCQCGVLSYITACFTAYWAILWTSSQCKLHNQKYQVLALIFVCKIMP